MGENKVKEFLSENFGQVRVITKDNELWFCATDVATNLNYDSTRKLTDKVDDEDIIEMTKSQLTNFGTWETTQTGGQNVKFINESGLYQGVLSVTKKDKNRYKLSRDFKRWITKEVIPTLRKDGMYVNGEENVKSEEDLIKSVEEKLEQKILRKFGKGIRRDLTDTIEENWQIRNRNQFATYTDQLINIPVLGCKSKQYKKENEIGDREALRDYLDIEKLDKVIKQEQDIATLVDYGLDYYQIKELVHKKIS